MISYEFYLNLDRTKFGNSYLDNILNKQNIPNYSISLKTYLKKVELDLRNLNFFNNVKTGLLASLFVPWCYHLENVIFFLTIFYHEERKHLDFWCYSTLTLHLMNHLWNLEKSNMYFLPL